LITLRSIKAAITKLLKTTYPDYKVHFDNVDRSDAPYFYIEFMPTSTTVDDVYSDRLIQVDVTYIGAKDAYGRINRTSVYDVADVLDRTIRPVLVIEDRHITIIDAEMTIVDDILHYIFNLDFRDAWTDAEVGRIQYELMQTLHLQLNGRDITEEE
jgi:hypothetical protein